MSNEFSRDGVLVNAVMPGHVLTARQRELNEIRSGEQGISTEEYTERLVASIPIRRHARPEEIGDVVAFLASDRASYITGATIQVDGGAIQSTF
jgi:3-oxoacyl-[acyl-carrier protein] reductase